MTTTILALTDALGDLVRFVLLPGHRSDTVGIAPLLAAVAFGGLIGDRAFARNARIAELDERAAKFVIAQHPRRASPLPLDNEMYQWRHGSRASSASPRRSSASPGAATRPTRASRP
jgi:hypothetical protein